MIKDMLFLEEIDSTNSYCKAHFNEMSDGAVVYTLNQSAGRARLGRIWSNTPGKALYLSQIVKTELVSPSTLPLAASLAVEDALERMYGITAQVKWPNDLLLSDKKLVGILCESVPEGYIIGVGVNVAQTQAQLDAQGLEYATSILIETGECPRDIGALALAISESFSSMLERFAKSGFASLRGEYRARCINLLHDVTAGDIKGKAVDINLDGHLVVRTDTGEEAVFTGEVSVGGIYGK